MPLVLIALILAAAPSRPVCPSATACGAMARRAMQAGDLNQARRAAVAQLHYSECAQEPQPGQVAEPLDTLARLSLRRGEPLMARAWLGVAAEERPAVPDATRARVAAAVARLPESTGVTGTYAKYLRAGLWDAVAVRQLDPERIEFSLSVLRLSGKWCDQDKVRGGFVNATAAEGDIAGEAVLDGGEFVFETREFMTEEAWSRPCVLRFRFEGDALHLTQESEFRDCGFGYGINASGEYLRSSRQRPVVEKRKPRPAPLPSPQP